MVYIRNKSNRLLSMFILNWNLDNILIKTKESQQRRLDI